jgi:hypothetical protein
MSPSCGVEDELVIDAVQHELGPSKHFERACVIDVAPCEVDKSLAALAVDYGTAKVELAVAADGGVDLKFPTGIGGITANKMFGVGPDLHADVDVVERCSVGIAESPAGQISAD